MRKYAFKFDRQVEGTEVCDVTVLADSEEEAVAKFNDGNWSMFLVQKRNLDTIASVITSMREVGSVG